MGDRNQYFFIKKIEDELEGPYLEVGSKDYGSTFDFRSLFSLRGKYLGIDMCEGKGVDLVLDLTDDFEVIDKLLKGEKFKTILCLSVLEHCENPFRMADNLTHLLVENGTIVVSVPFAWHFHSYPSDYWRFTHEGVKKLFPKIDFDLEKGCYTTTAESDFYPLDSSVGLIPFSFKANWKKGHFFRGLSSKCFKLLAKVGFLCWLAGNRYVLAPTMITMVGRLKNINKPSR